MGFALKLDTNGSYPDRLRSIIDKGLVDCVAMDIKNSKEKYPLTAGVDIDISKISESISLLLEDKIPFEFRTTVVKELHTPEDIVSISEWISGAKAYFLQSFTDSGDIIASGLSAYSPEEMKSILTLVQKNIPSAKLRGI